MAGSKPPQTIGGAERQRSFRAPNSAILILGSLLLNVFLTRVGLRFGAQSLYEEPAKIEILGDNRALTVSLTGGCTVSLGGGRNGLDMV